MSNKLPDLSDFEKVVHHLGPVACLKYAAKDYEALNQQIQAEAMKKSCPKWFKNIAISIGAYKEPPSPKEEGEEVKKDEVKKDEVKKEEKEEKKNKKPKVDN